MRSGREKGGVFNTKGEDSIIRPMGRGKKTICRQSVLLQKSACVDAEKGGCCGATKRKGNAAEGGRRGKRPFVSLYLNAKKKRFPLLRKKLLGEHGGEGGREGFLILGT